MKKNRILAAAAIVLLGGAAFRTQRLPEGVPTVYLDAPLAEIVEKIEAIMRHS